MADTYQTAKNELEDLLDDAVFASGGSLNSMLLTWSNRLIKDICLEIPMRYHLESVEAALTGGSYIWSLPTDFFAVSQRFTKFRVSADYVDIVGLDTLNSYDPAHADTTTGPPTAISIEGNSLYSYPACTCTGVLENYLREPTDMAATSSSPDIPWIYYVTDMIVAGVAGKYGFPYLNEYEQAKYWKDRYKELLDKYRLHVEKSNSMQVIERMFY
jgi:hypothetical protein